ncbi:MAG: 3-phosphoshikimate 1-carboxyvinyltransferase [Gammaproteobacteria bacterium]|nr:MAG: 3-phosphoshikimate 1-carboxyvinyltransferase [Gammaproteobacteria bacterium]
MTSTDAAAVSYSLQPASALKGRFRVPGDKSMSHRAMMFGGIADGVTEVSGFLEGEDCLHTLEAFEALGVRVERPGAGQVVLHGGGTDSLVAPKAPVYLGNSGTGMRLLTGLFAGLNLPVTFTGDASLSTRPMRRITEPLALMGARVGTTDAGTPPLEIVPGDTLVGIDYRSPLASAQVKSAILLAGLHASGRTTVHEPAVTRDHTERMLRGFGVEVDVDGLKVSLEGGQKLRATTLTVPGDISSAAFFLVGAAMTPGSELTVEGVGVNPTRTGIVDILKLMGATIEPRNEREVSGEPVADLHVVGGRLRGIDVPERLVSLAIDEFPALFVAAVGAEGITRVTGAEELRVKETDRIQVMCDGLRALGADIEDFPDGARINGGRLDGGEADSCGDHRTTMAFSMASLLADGPVTVRDCANVNTSFPDFAVLAKRAGLAIEVY